jgi:hypothetical protein
MPALVSNNGDADAIRRQLTKINDIRKAVHQRPANIRLDYHPAPRVRRNPQDLTLKFINELRPKAG